MIFQKKRIYLDNAALTPIDFRVARYMKTLEKKCKANPSSIHLEGVVVQNLLHDARQQVARLLEVKESEVIFTASGTEADNLAVRGFFEACTSSRKPFHFITTTIEHSAIIESAEKIKRSGAEVTYVPVEENGIVSVKNITQAIRPETRLVSVMYVNNEIGTIQPIREISRIIAEENKNRAKEDRIFLHTDAAQALLFLPIEQQRLGADMLTLDSIKIGGPSGVGCLIRKHSVALEPLVVGGGQEDGYHSGTQNVLAIAGFAKALEYAVKEREETSQQISVLRDYMIKGLLEKVSGAELNGDKEKRIANNVNICVPGKLGEFIVLQLDAVGVACATASACRTLSKNGESYVVSALGKKTCAESSLRFTLGKNTTKRDIDSVVQKVSSLK